MAETNALPPNTFYIEVTGSGIPEVDGHLAYDITSEDDLPPTDREWHVYKKGVAPAPEVVLHHFDPREPCPRCCTSSVPSKCWKSESLHGPNTPAEVMITWIHSKSIKWGTNIDENDGFGIGGAELGRCFCLGSGVSWAISAEERSKAHCLHFTGEGERFPFRNQVGGFGGSECFAAFDEGGGELG